MGLLNRGALDAQQPEIKAARRWNGNADIAIHHGGHNGFGGTVR